MPRMTVDAFAQGMVAALGTRLVTLLLYGSAARGAQVPDGSDVNTLLVSDTVDEDLFARLAAPVRAWTRAGHPAPLIFAEREWRESADAFPIEYEDIRAAHRLLAGRDPWQGIAVQREHVRRQLEHELMGKLVHLRQAYAAQWHDRKRLAETIRGSAAGFYAMLRAVLRLAGKTPPAASEALVREAGSVIGFPADGLMEPAAYLNAVARTAAHVNRMERTPS